MNETSSGAAPDEPDAIRDPDPVPDAGAAQRHKTLFRGILGPGPIILGGGAVLLILFLVVGYLLPTRWSAQAELELEATPTDLMAFLDSPEGWRRWTPWPDSGVVREGPEHGAGASLRWDDPELGSGSFTIGETSDSIVRYEVRVGGAAGSVMQTHGSVSLHRTPQGTLVRWHEEGNLGHNPLMGYWALFMSRAQSAELAKGLDRLRSDSAPSR